MNRSHRILVVDDEPMVCDSVRRMLMSGGHEVEMAAGGEEALHRLKSDSFDVVVVDYLMPGMRGDELSQRIKERNARQPIVMISSSAELLTATGRQFPGVDFIVGKPFQLDELMEVIARAVPDNPPRNASSGPAPG